MLQLYELSVLKTVAAGEVAKAASGSEVQEEFDGDAECLQAPVGRALAFVPRAHHSYLMITITPYLMLMLSQT